MNHRTRNRRALAAALAVTASITIPSITTSPLLAQPAAALANSGVVRTWNGFAVEALTNASGAAIPGAGQPPQVSVIHLAMVQAAVFDAVNSIEGGYQPYLDGLTGAGPDASVDAAVATAAHHVLTGLGIVPVPALPAAALAKLDERYAAALVAITDGPAEDAGIAVGAAAAAGILAERTGDGRYVPTAFTTGTGIGEWQTTPPANLNDPFAWVAKVEPFGLERASQVRTRGPLDVDSVAYAREYAEVKELGAVGSARTPAQQAAAEFFVAHPVQLYNRAFREIAAGRSLPVIEEARLYALLNVSGADAIIGCWDDKEYYHYWRPLTAIRNGDTDGNSRTVGDATWTPLVGNPPYPDHPSGYNCITSAFMHAGMRFFDSNRVDFQLTRTTPAGDVTRTYRHLLDVIDDTIDARVWMGLHFRTADVQGAELGKRAARWIDQHYFLPVS